MCLQRFDIDETAALTETRYLQQLRKDLQIPPNVSFQSHITKQKAKPLKKFHEKPPPLVTQEDLLIFFHQFTAQKANL
jgi:hypothetical protein